MLKLDILIIEYYYYYEVSSLFTTSAHGILCSLDKKELVQVISFLFYYIKDIIRFLIEVPSYM